MAAIEPDDDRRDPAPAVSRSIRLLGILADARRAMSLTEIAGALSLAKSSTANLCLALEAGGMIARVPTGYQLGLRTAELGGAFAAQFNQIREFYSVCEASPVLREELVQVALLDGRDALYLARHEGSRLVRLGTPLGTRLPAALSATGRALLMALTDDRVTELLQEADVPQLTGRSTRDVATLLKILAEARARGWSMDDGESISGIVGLAVPLPGWSPSDPDLALGVALPVAEATYERVERVGRALQDAARALTNPFSAQVDRANG